LGRSGDQQRAIEEFAQQPSENGLYASIEELLTDYRANLESRRQLTPEDEELIMNLSAAYLRKQQEWKQEVRQELVINLLREGSSVEFVAKVTGLTIAEVEGWASQEINSASNPT
jgi:predicted anti-sigma-YlaC factor YlaD